MPTKVLQGITLEEAWSKIKPNLSHFRVFGCEAWDHILDEKWKALQPKSEKCIFVGYSEDVKGHILLQPHSHDIIIKRDVKFDENVLSYEPNLVGVPSLACDPNSAIVPSSSSSSNFLDRFPTPFLMMTVRIKIHLFLLMFLQLHQYQCFLDGSIQHVKQLVILPVILEINNERVLSFSEPLLFWLKFPRIMIEKLLQKL